MTTPSAEAGVATEDHAKTAAWFDTHAVRLRWILAGPGALIGSILVLAAAPAVLPAGAAGLNHITLPALAHPLIWAALFFYACLEGDLRRACRVFGGVFVASIVAIAVLFLH